MMGGGSQQYCLRWKNHSSNLLTVFEELLQNEAFTDVTLAVEGGVSIKCHRVVLAACSPYFQSLFIDLPCKHPIVVLKDVKYSEIKGILEYIYRGEVNVQHDQLNGLLHVAETLKVKGLVEEHTPLIKRIQEAETSVTSPPPSIDTTSSTIRANGHVSPTSRSMDCSYNCHTGLSGLERTHSRQSVPGMWPLAALPVHPGTAHQQPLPLIGGSYDNGYENSPLKRKKISNLLMNRDTPILRTVLGQEHADSSQAIPLLNHDIQDNHARINGHEDDRRSSVDLSHGDTAHSSHTDGSAADDEEKQISPKPYESKPGAGCKKVKLKGMVNYSPGQKPEWRRYKQYTREDLNAAIEAVRSGMSALRAAPKFGVPSRTLYDKLRNLGITTSRPFKRGSNGSSACFPYGIGGNANGGIYPSGFLDSESDGQTAHLENPGTLYESKVRESVSSDRENAIELARYSPRPMTHAMTKQETLEDQADDLSLTRKSELSVIVPPFKDKEDREILSNDTID